MSPKVWNKHDPLCPHDAIYVGRPSKWGNPWTIGKDGSREEVIAMYARALPSMLKAQDDDGTIILDIRELRGRDLVCWCAPLLCHADILLEIANKETP